MSHPAWLLLTSPYLLKCTHQIEIQGFISLYHLAAQLTLLAPLCYQKVHLIWQVKSHRLGDNQNTK